MSITFGSFLDYQEVKMWCRCGRQSKGNTFPYMNIMNFQLNVNKVGRF